MKRAVVGAVVAAVATLTLVVGSAGPASAQNLQDTPIVGGANPCLAYLSIDLIFGECGDVFGFIGPVGQPLPLVNGPFDFGDAFNGTGTGDGAGTSDATAPDTGGFNFGDFLNGFNLVSSDRGGAAGLAPIGAVLAGMVLVYGTLIRIVRRRLTATG